MKERVLCVDDDTNVLRALKRVFRNQAFHFITFDSPKQALIKLDQIKPAVVLSDQSMPEMEGTVFLQEVKKRQPDTVRIIMTGYADMQVAIASINQGNVFRFIQKPLKDVELKSEIISALEYHEAISGLRLLGEKGVEDVVIKRERLQGIRELAIAVRHEMGQSMAVISGYSHLLQQFLDKDSVLNFYISNIVTQIKKMEELTTKITSIAKYETIENIEHNRMVDIDRASLNNR